MNITPKSVHQHVLNFFIIKPRKNQTKTFSCSARKTIDERAFFVSILKCQFMYELPSMERAKKWWKSLTASVSKWKIFIFWWRIIWWMISVWVIFYAASISSSRFYDCSTNTSCRGNVLKGWKCSRVAHL